MVLRYTRLRQPEKLALTKREKMDRRTPDSHEVLASRPAEEMPGQPEARRHSRTTSLIVWLLALLAFGLLFYWVLSRKPAVPAAGGPGGGRGRMGGVVPVSIATARRGDVNQYLDAIGTVTPLHTVAINSQITGTVTAVHFREGQVVRQGDPLIDIDARPVQAQLMQAEGTLERDENLLAQGRMNLERYKQAWSKNAIPRQTLEDQEKVVLQQQGTVKNDQGQVQYAEAQLSYAHIKSPITGRVGLRLVDQGNLVTANSAATLVVVTQEQPITVVFTIPEDNLPQVMQHSRARQALPVEALDRTQQGHLATGKLTSIDNQIDTTTGTVKLRAEFENRDRALFPNQFVNTRLLVNKLTNQVLIPSSAIQHNGNADFVYVIANNKAVQTPIKAGLSDRGETAVLQGLKEGDVVANSSFEKLQNNSQVTVSKTKMPANNEGAASTAP